MLSHKGLILALGTLIQHLHVWNIFISTTYVSILWSWRGHFNSKSLWASPTIILNVQYAIIILEEWFSKWLIKINVAKMVRVSFPLEEKHSLQFFFMKHQPWWFTMVLMKLDIWASTSTYDWHWISCWLKTKDIRQKTQEIIFNNFQNLPRYFL